MELEQILRERQYLYLDGSKLCQLYNLLCDMVEADYSFIINYISSNTLARDYMNEAKEMMDDFQDLVVVMVIDLEG
ncbi:unnamed protein product [Dovyalis caffra]|uniref:Uncharacterized protein n=1 Tax=Dovyalis caffra TaxID=77055 RepID=A0AAV1RNI7_9ROSI|nr:unnamed protein product [Dovyalis caffra]